MDNSFKLSYPFHKTVMGPGPELTANLLRQKNIASTLTEKKEASAF